MDSEELSNRLCEINSCVGVLMNLEEGYERMALFNVVNRDMLDLIDRINDVDDVDDGDDL
jgi:hypothetical protein